MAGKNAVISYLNTYGGSNAILDDPGGIDASIETIIVDANYSHGFVVNTLLLIDSEYMLVTAVTDTHTLTVTRGYDNSTATTHNDNAAVDGVNNWVDIVHSGTTNSALISLEFADALGTPTIALVRIQNKPVDSSASNAGTEPGQFTGVFTDFMKIRIKDAETQLVYFYGVIFSLTETYEPQWGMVLDLECKDYLTELKDNSTQGYAGFEIDPSVALSTYVNNFAKSNIDQKTNLNKTAIGGRSAIIKSLIVATTGNLDFVPQVSDTRFEDSEAAFEQKENYELGPKNQKSVLQHISSISATDPHDVTTNEQVYGYDYYVDPNVQSPASSYVANSFFNYFKKGTRPNVAPATYGLQVERPSSGGFVETGRKVPMMDFEFNRPKGEIFTDAIVTYKFIDESSEDGSTSVGSKTTTFEVIEIKGVANLSPTVPRWKDLPITSGYKEFGEDDGVLLPEWLRVRLDGFGNYVASGGTLTPIARMQYINRITGTINDANPVYILISDVDESIAASAWADGVVWSGMANSSLSFTIKSRPRSKYGVRRSLTMTVGESVKPNTIRQKIAAALMRNSVQVIRGSFSTMRRPEYYLDNSPVNVTGASSEQTIFFGNSVNVFDYGVRVGMPVVKLVNDRIPNTGVVYGYITGIVATYCLIQWNTTNAVSTSDTLRFIVPVRAGDIIDVTNPLVNITNNKFLVTKVVYAEQPGVSNTTYTVVGAETNREGGYAAKNFQSVISDSVGQEPNLPPDKPKSGNIGESSTSCVFTSGGLLGGLTLTNSAQVYWTTGTLTIGTRRYAIDAGNTSDSMISPANLNIGQVSSPLAQAVDGGDQYAVQVLSVDDASVFAVHDLVRTATIADGGTETMIVVTTPGSTSFGVLRGIAGSAATTYDVDEVLYNTALVKLPIDDNSAQATTALNGDITSTTATSVPVDSGAVFAINDTIRVDNEHMIITAISTDTLTVSRNQFGSTAATHSDDAPVYSTTLVGQDYYIYYPGTGTKLKTVKKSNYRNVVGNEPDPIVIGWCRAGSVEAEFSVWVQEFSMGTTKGDASKKLTKGSAFSSLLKKGAQHWSTNVKFEGTDYNIARWGLGTSIGSNGEVSFGDDDSEAVTFHAGTTFAAGVSWVYKRVGDNGNPELVVTQNYNEVTRADSDRILMATIVVATDAGQGSPTILPVNGNTPTLSVGAFAARSILAADIKTGSITTAELNFAPTINGNTDTTANIRGTAAATAGTIAGLAVTASTFHMGTGTYANANTPFFVRGVAETIDDVAYTAGDFSLGSKFKWDESASLLTIEGSIRIAGSSTTLTETNTLNTNTTAANVSLGSVDDLNAQGQAQAGLIAQTTIDGGGIIMSGGGSIYSAGHTAAVDATKGFFLGHDGVSAGGGDYDFGIGSSGGDSLVWDGSAGTLNITGTMTIGDSIFAAEGTAPETSFLKFTAPSLSDAFIYRLQTTFGYTAGDMIINTQGKAIWVHDLLGSTSETTKLGHYNQPWGDVHTERMNLNDDNSSHDNFITIAYVGAGDDDSSAKYTITFPVAGPSGNNLIQTDSSGNLSFSAFVISATTIGGAGGTANDEAPYIYARTLSCPGAVQFAGLLDQPGDADVRITDSGIIREYTSSKKNKENIIALTVNTSKIFDLVPKTFTWKNVTDIFMVDGVPTEVLSVGRTDFGLIAEEVYEILPELVGKNTSGEPMSVFYSQLSILLLEELKKLKTRVGVLEGG